MYHGIHILCFENVITSSRISVAIYEKKYLLIYFIINNIQVEYYNGNTSTNEINIEQCVQLSVSFS